MRKSDNILIIGIGNEYRGDDAAGLIAAEKLREKRIDNVTVRLSNRDGSALLLLWEGYDNVILIDAVSSGSPVGTPHKIDLHNTDLDEQPFHASGHSFSIFETVKLAGYIGKVPSTLLLYGIEGTCFSMGDEMSADVVIGIDNIIENIMKFVAGRMDLAR